jgi:signal peptidase II
VQAARGTPLTRAARHTTWLLAAVAVAVLLLDLLTKYLVVEHLERRDPIRLLGGALLLAVSRNSGAAFSFAQGATVVFTAVAVTVIVGIVRTARQLGSTGWAVCLGLLLGGATGNLVDRIFRAPGPGRGAVVDFIDFRVWPVFNLADSAIVCGGQLAVLLTMRGIELDGSRKSEDPADDPAE